jgi:hypothetical protein
LTDTLNPQVTERSRQTLIKWLQLSINFNGQHFDHLHKSFCWLKIPSYSVWLILQIFYFYCILLPLL